MHCPKCGVVEDEKHAVFFCEMYSDLRAGFPELFVGIDRLRGLFLTDKIDRLAEFIYLCYRKRQAWALSG